MTNSETVASLPEWAQKVISDLRTEAATNRQAATDLKAERDTLRSEANERATAEALSGLSKVLTDPSDLTRYVDPGTLLGEDGKPDPAKYLEAATSLAGERPHLAPRVGAGASPVGGDWGRSHESNGNDLDANAASGRAAFVDMFQAAD